MYYWFMKKQSSKISCYCPLSECSLNKLACWNNMVHNEYVQCLNTSCISLCESTINMCNAEWTCCMSLHMWMHSKHVQCGITNHVTTRLRILWTCWHMQMKHFQKNAASSMIRSWACMSKIKCERDVSWHPGMSPLDQRSQNLKHVHAPPPPTL